MRMERALGGGSGPLWRQLFREWVVRVECRSEARQKQGQTWYAPAGGTIVVRRDVLLGGLLNAPMSGTQPCSPR
jgi:hypothetical protein